MHSKHKRLFLWTSFISTNYSLLPFLLSSPLTASRPTLSQFQSLKIRRSVNSLLFIYVVWRILKLQSCERFGRVPGLQKNMLVGLPQELTLGQKQGPNQNTEIPSSVPRKFSACSRKLFVSFVVSDCGGHFSIEFHFLLNPILNKLVYWILLHHLRRDYAKKGWRLKTLDAKEAQL